MNYNVDKLFRFAQIDGGYLLTNYAQRECGVLSNSNAGERVTELEIPAEYNGEPVVAIGKSAFDCAEYLERVTIPEGVRRIGKNAFQSCKKLRFVSLEEIDEDAFGWCEELCEVEFKSSPSFNISAFSKDYKLPAELVLVGALRSHDPTRAILNEGLQIDMALAIISPKAAWFLVRPDVYALALKNGGFRQISAEYRLRLFECFIENGCTEQL